jgi:exodeoxyribonuclease VII large subunit
VLDRGYSITEDRHGRVVRDATRLVTGQDLKITFARGWADARVERKS